jgi:hypothetical protein
MTAERLALEARLRRIGTDPTLHDAPGTGETP